MYGIIVPSTATLCCGIASCYTHIYIFFILFFIKNEVTVNKNYWSLSRGYMAGSCVPGEG